MPGVCTDLLIEINRFLKEKKQHSMFYYQTGSYTAMYLEIGLTNVLSLFMGNLSE